MKPLIKWANLLQLERRRLPTVPRRRKDPAQRSVFFKVTKSRTKAMVARHKSELPVMKKQNEDSLNLKKKQLLNQDLNQRPGLLCKRIVLFLKMVPELLLRMVPELLPWMAPELLLRMVPQLLPWMAPELRHNPMSQLFPNQLSANMLLLSLPLR